MSTDPKPEPGGATAEPLARTEARLEPAAAPAGPAEADAAAADARYLAWKKNATHLYETLLAFELPWPSLTVQWLPEQLTKARPAKGDGGASAEKRQRLVLATSTGGQAPEYLRVAELRAPETAAPASLSEYDADVGTIGGHQPAYAADVEIVQRILVQGTVARARHMPQNPNVLATVSSTGEAAIWDITKFPYNPVPHYVPTTRLAGAAGGAPGGHRGEGLCLAWSPTAEGQLATGDATGQILVWDLRRDYDSRTGTMAPVQARRHAQGSAVNDVHWHPRRPATLASVGDDGALIVHQTGAASADPVVEHRFTAARPTAVAWNPVNEALIAVGFDSGRIELWDLRSIPTLVSTLEAHTGYVTALHWNTWHPSVLASASEDGTVRVWNAVRFGGPPLFTHGGHRAPVTDVAWNPAVPNMLASVSEDNGLHVYTPGADVLGF